MDKVMNYIISFSLTLFLCYSSYSQDTEGKIKSNWKLGVVVMPGFSHKIPATDYTPYMSFSEFDYNDRAKLSLAGGLRFICALSERSELEFSTLFIDRGYSVPNYFCLGFECNRQVNLIYYLDIPVLYRYKVLQCSKTDVFWAGGIAPGIPLNKFGYDKYSNPEMDYTYIPPTDNRDYAIIIQDNNFVPVGIGFHTSVKTVLPLSEKMTLEMGPGIQIAMMSFTKHRKYVEHNGNQIEVGEPRYRYVPYFIGLDLSLYISK